MGETLSRLTMTGLLFLHVALLVWALTGLAEWIFGAVPWPAVANPLFPRPMLLAHWLSVAVTACIFLAGYALRWPGTPLAVAAGYAAMATVCLIETTQYLVHDARWLAMGLEYAAYLGIGFYLFRSAHAQAVFGGTGGLAGTSG
ncbi:hypothetical protein [Parvibaculum sp.]|jgi:hypothetical protein|uniref:hypothetical protein n=1 Tax=Parvibaculum sp. TaxID=2024848 RepID=UPI002FD90026